jgi:hypothetical protein
MVINNLFVFRQFFRNMRVERFILLLIIIFVCRSASGQDKHKPVTINPSQGYANFYEITCAYGIGTTTEPYSKYYYGMTTSQGYQLNFYGLNIKRSIFGGLGTGIIVYNGGGLLPVFADLRFTWYKKKISPFVYGNTGFLFDFHDFFDNARMFINGGGGIKIKFDSNLFASFGTGLQIQMGNTSRESFLNLRIGLGFKSN